MSQAGLAGTPPKLHKCSNPAYFTSQLPTGLRATASQGALGQGAQRWLRPGEASRGTGAATAGADAGRADGCSLCRQSIKYILGQQRPEEVIVREQQRRLRPQAVCGQGRGSHC